MKKNVVSIVILDFSSHGGVRVIINIANILAESGYDIHIYSSRKPTKMPYELSPMVKVHYATKLKNKVLAFLIYPFLLPFILTGDILISTFYYVRLPTKMASILRKSEYFYFIQGVECFRSGGILNILNFLCKASLNEKKIFASNRYLSKEVFKKNGRKINFINVGPSSIFFKKELTTKIKIFDIVYFARGEKFKRLDLFLDLFSNNEFLEKQLKIVIITLDIELANNLKSMNLQGCKIISPSDDNELISIIDQSKLLFFTSEYEGLGLPPLECMLRGLPVVTYKTYPLTDYFNNSELSNLLVDNTTSAVSAINNILFSPELYSNYSKMSKNLVQGQFSENYADEFIKYINNGTLNDS
jgi:glycosyltransferase involved in cell wall biosynthesis